MLRSLSLFSALLVVASTAASAAADFKEDQKFCNSRDTKPVVGIAACTRQIHSGRLKGHDLAIAYYNRGTFRYNENDYDQAIADYTNSLKFSPSYAAAYNNRGNAYAAKGDLDRAIADYDQAILIDGKDASCWNNRGLAWSRKGYYERAIADFDQAIRLDPGYTAAHVHRKVTRSIELPPPTPELPGFPWPPPKASTSYVLPNQLFEIRRTVGEVVTAIISALERNGYVERSFFRTENGGVALVTRLERIREDGSSFAERERWPARERDHMSTVALINFLRGLFFVHPGRYRVIVFILQDLPFSQSPQKITGEEAHAWLSSGANILPPLIADRPFAGGHCTVLVYEFSSDGTAVRVVESNLTGKQHLEKAGVLSHLERPARVDR